MVPIKYHLALGSKSWINLGAGPFAEWQFWQIQRQYDDAEYLTRIYFGAFASLGYSLHLNEIISIDTNVNFNYYFGQAPFMLKVYLGTTITLFSKETRAPWL
jgi:hypothetical protein